LYGSAGKIVEGTLDLCFVRAHQLGCTIQGNIKFLGTSEETQGNADFGAVTTPRLFLDLGVDKAIRTLSIITMGKMIMDFVRFSWQWKSWLESV
jgi:hypothetical protein